MGFYPVAVCYNARQDNTVQYNTITHNTQDNTQYTMLQKHQEHIDYWESETSRT
jgi:hypothetical protein